MMEEHDQVRVRNLGDETFEGIHLGRTTRIPPGEESVWVPAPAAILWFGDPSAIDHVENGEARDDRTKECLRLDARYGIFPIRRDEAQTTPPRTREDAWPKVKVKSMDGEEIRMVVHDPEGVHVAPAASETVSERRDMLATIEDLKKRVERYEAEVARSGQPPADTPIADAPTRRTKAS